MSTSIDMRVWTFRFEIFHVERPRCDKYSIILKFIDQNQ